MGKLAKYPRFGVLTQRNGIETQENEFNLIMSHGGLGQSARPRDMTHGVSTLPDP